MKDYIKKVKESIILLFKKLFLRDEEKTIIEEENLKKENNNSQIDNFSSIEITDIIWAKRYYDEKDKKTIPKRHREGPFIVIDKIEDNLICLYGTSIKENDSNTYFKLDNNGYFLPKQTYFDIVTKRTIIKDQYIRKLDSLNDSDRKDLLNKIKEENCAYYFHNKQKVYFHVPHNIGDIIIQDDKKYLILDIQNNKLLCITISNKFLNTYNLNEINFDELVWIDEKKQSEFLKQINPSILKNILKKQKEYINRNNIQRGSLVCINENYYYIFGEEGQEWLAFEVSFEKKPLLDKLQINKIEVYSNYNNLLKINKKDQNIKVIDLATDLEKDQIKKQKKSYQKSHKKVRKQSNNSIRIGSIIKNKQFKNKQFIVVNCDYPTYQCLSIEDIINGNYFLYYFKNKNIYISKNSNIKDIKWFAEHQDFELCDININIAKEIISFQNEYLNRNKTKVLK